MAQTLQVEMNLPLAPGIDSVAKSGLEFLGRNDKSAAQAREWLATWLGSPVAPGGRDLELRKAVLSNLVSYTLLETMLPKSGLSPSLDPFSALGWHWSVSAPVRVSGEELVMEEDRMETGHFYQTDYHGHEYLIRKKDENVIDIYVVEE